MLLRNRISEYIRGIFLFPLFITFLFSAFLRMIGKTSDNLSNIVLVFMVVLFAIYIVLQQQIRLRNLFILFFIFAFLFVSFIKNPYQNDRFMEDFKTFIFICVPCLLMYSSGVNEYTYKTIGILSIVSGMFFVLIYIVQTFITPILNNFDYQTISYTLILPIFFLLQSKKNVWKIILLSVLLFFMFFSGGRGPILCVFLFIIYKIMLKRRQLILKTIFVCIAVALALNAEAIINCVIDLSNRFGLVSSFSFYAKLGNIFSDSNRNAIYTICLEKASLEWATGYGLFGDRLWSSIDYAYPHNIFIEIVCDFGWATAIAMVLLLTIGSFAFLFSKNILPSKKRVFELVFFGNGFLILLFSSSYLIQPAFFALVGLLVDYYCRNIFKKKIIPVDYNLRRVKNG